MQVSMKHHKENYRHILSCLALLKIMMSFIIVLEGEICGDSPGSLFQGSSLRFML